MKTKTISNVSEESLSDQKSRSGVEAHLSLMNPVLVRIIEKLQSPALHANSKQLGGVLQGVRKVFAVDGVFIALFDELCESIEKIASARATETVCQLDVLAGEKHIVTNEFAHRLKSSQIIEWLDTAAASPEDSFARCLSAIQIGSALVANIAVQQRTVGLFCLFGTDKRTDWDQSCHGMLTVLASSYAAGFERYHLDRELSSLKARQDLAMSATYEGMWDVDFERGVLYLSPRWKAMLGYEDHELNDLKNWRQFVHADDYAVLEVALSAHVAGKTPYFESTYRVKHRSGDWRWVRARAKAQTNEAGKLLRLVGVELDITETKLSEEALFREKVSAQITLQSIGDGVITTDAQGQIEYLNPVAESLTGWSAADAVGHPIDDVFRFFHEETCEPLENPLLLSIRRSHIIKSVRPTLLIRRDGNELYIESCASPIRDGVGLVSGGVLVFNDVSESRELNRKLSYHASHDLLTGLVNRHEFEQRIELALKNARARHDSYAVCYIDLDQFKLINDTCGHNAGDALLGQVGALFKSKVRWRDTVSRLGGDEFGILLEASTMDDAMRTAETLRDAVLNYKFDWESRTFRIGASIGVVPITAENDGVAGILSAAEAACSAAKEAGRNRIYSFQENDLDLMRRRREMQWAARINNALEDGRFEIFRQLIQPLHGHESGLHYELLLRMRDEQGKVVTPDQFITAAERYNIMPSIDRWVIEHVFRWLVSEADEREKLALCSINLSGQSLSDDKFLPFVIDRLHRSGIDGSKICFEITETAAVASFSQANRFIQALKDLGCKFALDDFGTGLSSFGYLKNFPVDFLKIDGSFVKDLLHDPIDREMVRSINEIGHLTGKRTIAEFAENQEIVDMLRGLGVDYAQGYGIAIPERVLKIQGEERHESKGMRPK